MKKLIIDTDPGKDDAVAILAALGLPGLDIRMLGTVGGNVPLNVTTRNALSLCDLAGRRDIPVHAGCPKAILRPANPVPDIHGQDGMGDVGLTLSQRDPAPTHAVPALIEAIRTSSAPVTIAALAPLTNIALALTMAPDIIANIAEIVVMGGSFSGGNITPYASFNMHSDPHAAQVVFASGAPVTMVGLEITRQVMPPAAWVADLARSGHPAARLVAAMWRNPTMCMNDACVTAWIAETGLFTFDMAHVTIETANPVELGRTTKTEGTPNARVLTSINVGGFFDLIQRGLQGAA